MDQNRPMSWYPTQVGRSRLHGTSAAATAAAAAASPYSYRGAPYATPYHTSLPSQLATHSVQTQQALEQHFLYTQILAAQHPDASMGGMPGYPMHPYYGYGAPPGYFGAATHSHPPPAAAFTSYAAAAESMQRRHVSLYAKPSVSMAAAPALQNSAWLPGTVGHAAVGIERSPGGTKPLARSHNHHHSPPQPQESGYAKKIKLEKMLKTSNAKLDGRNHYTYDAGQRVGNGGGGAGNAAEVGQGGGGIARRRRPGIKLDQVAVENNDFFDFSSGNNNSAPPPHSHSQPRTRPFAPHLPPSLPLCISCRHTHHHLCPLGSANTLWPKGSGGVGRQRTGSPRDIKKEARAEKGQQAWPVQTEDQGEKDCSSQGGCPCRGQRSRCKAGCTLF